MYMPTHISGENHQTMGPACSCLDWYTKRDRRLALQILRDKRPHIFQSTYAAVMVLFMWQDNMKGVVRFTDKCLEWILYTSDQA